MNNLDKKYQKLLQDILDNGYIKGDRTGTGTISVFGREIRHKMSEGFPLLTTKKMYFKGIVTELLWFLKGDTNIKYLVDNDCHIWDGDAYKNYCKSFESQSEIDKHSFDTDPMTQVMFIEKIKHNDSFAKQWGELGPIYGKQWRKWTQLIPYDVTDENCKVSVQVIDQIQNLINTLKTNPDDRRMLVTAWNPAELYQSILPPCHYGFQVYTRELSLEERTKIAIGRVVPLLGSKEDSYNEAGIPRRAISLRWHQRSCDTPLGIPFNIASYGLLLSILGEMVNMVPEELSCSLGDTHIYLNQIDGVKEQLLREPFDLPKLYINTEFWLTESGECGIGPLCSDFDKLINSINIEDFQLENYKSHAAIKIPLSN